MNTDSKKKIEKSLRLIIIKLKLYLQYHNKIKTGINGETKTNLSKNSTPKNERKACELLYNLFVVSVINRRY